MPGGISLKVYAVFLVFNAKCYKYNIVYRSVWWGRQYCIRIGVAINRFIDFDNSADVFAFWRIGLINLFDFIKIVLKCL